MAATPLRRDAQRNRDRLVEVARAAFAHGGDSSLDAIARGAGVGIGTLYRHFPTREALVEAVYESELEDVCANAERLAAELPADAALRAWMDRYVEFVRAKRGMADALPAVLAAGAGSETRARIRGAVDVLRAADASTRLLRDDVDSDDVVAGMIGVCLATRAPGQEAQTARLLDLLLAGLRAPSAP
jgi:AcrR family transcriptional regulator